MKSHELFAELASENRIAILKALEKEPLKFTHLTSVIDATSPETSRQLNRLSKMDLIVKDGNGSYSLTSLGKLVVSSISNLETIAKISDFFLHHDTSPIPPHLLREIDSLKEGEVIEGVFVLVNRMTEVFEEIHEYAWYLSDDFPRFFIPMVEKKLDEGVNFRAIYPGDFAEKLLVDVPENILNSTEILTLDEVNIIINVTDRFGLLALPGPDGKVDRDNVLVGSDDVFIDWCKKVFEYYWGTARHY
jgi:predicted transcriptional regulator